VPNRRRGHPGVRTHHARLPADEITEIDGIPVTTVPRTLLDLASVLSPHQLERAINEAAIRGHSDSLSLPDLIARHPGRKGVGLVRALLETDPASPAMSSRPASEASFVRAAFRPRFNHNVQGYECDCVWPDRAIIACAIGRSASPVGP
jgi:hypothetical protein